MPALALSALRYWREAIIAILVCALFFGHRYYSGALEDKRNDLAACNAARAVQNARIKQMASESEAEHARQQLELERARQVSRNDAPVIIKLEESAKESHPGCISPTLKESLPL